MTSRRVGFMSKQCWIFFRDCKRWLRTTAALKILLSYIRLIIFIMKEKS